jgi:hypothetical protein
MAIVAGVDHVIYVFLPSLPFVLDGSLDCSGKGWGGCHPSSRVPDRSTKIGRLLAARRLSFSAWFARRRGGARLLGLKRGLGRRELNRCDRLLPLSDCSTAGAAPALFWFRFAAESLALFNLQKLHFHESFGVLLWVLNLGIPTPIFFFCPS